MAILVDTNILLRSAQTHHPHYALVERAFSILRARNETLNVGLATCGGLVARLLGRSPPVEAD